VRTLRSSLHSRLTLLLAVMTRTLLSLSLTSRRWTSSAVRSLYFDPTRCLTKFGTSEHALRFLQKLIRRPGLSAYVRALNRLPSVAESFFEVGCENEELHLATWTLDVLRRCPHVHSVAISPDCSDVNGLDWREEIGLLKHLRHLTVASMEPESVTVGEGVMRLLLTLGDLSLSSLTLERFCLDEPVTDDGEKRKIKVRSVKLVDVCLHSVPSGSIPPFLTPSLRHLRIKPGDNQRGSLSDYLCPSLLTFVYEPARPPQAPPSILSESYDMDVRQVSFLFDVFPSLPHLTKLVLKNVYLDLSHLTTITANCPVLKILDLDGSTWFPADWEPEGSAEETVKNAILRLPSLTKLALGWVPVVREFEIFFIKSTCKSRGVELSYKRSLSSRKKNELTC
jgi:hypothetical protein